MSDQGDGDSPDQAQQQAVRSAQERTLGLYHQLMQINAASHLIRSLRKLGLIDALREQQCTLEQLCVPKSLDAEVVREILDAAVAIGIVEQYQEDYALSRAAHLLCQYDHDLVFFPAFASSSVGFLFGRRLVHLLGSSDASSDESFDASLLWNFFVTDRHVGCRDVGCVSPQLDR